MKTLGGRQFWGDVHFFHKWRIQQNILTKHYRLLDGDDYRHTWGTYEDCHAKLRAVRDQHKLQQMSGKVVILVHGIVRSSKSFDRMRQKLEEQGYVVLGFDYPSTQVSMAESAAYLRRSIESLEGVEQISFVTHSMGGLIVRAYLAEHHDPRVHRIVMIGVPNRGAHMADRVKDWWLFKGIYGPAGQQLVSDPEGLIPKLPVPECEFAIIAGGRGHEDGYNPLIPGDDDGTVSVASTRLPGADDFIIVRGMHSFLISYDEVIGHTARYLETGRLRPEGPAEPIPELEQEPATDTAAVEAAENRK